MTTQSLYFKANLLAHADWDKKAGDYTENSGFCDVAWSDWMR